MTNADPPPDSTERLQQVAEQVWGLGVRQVLPVTESFASDVLLFDADDGRRYVIKNSFNPAKGQREIAALEALASHERVPNLLGHHRIADEMYLLIEGLDGTPWVSIEGTSRQFLAAVGAAMGEVHQTRYGSFDGCDNWHDLLRHNADRYHHTIGAEDRELADIARVELEQHMAEVPNSDEPVLVQFDLRPGNILSKAEEFVALIDFESARGGHPSMDFFKFWQQVEPFLPGAMESLLAGYLSDRVASDWMTAEPMGRLMKIYSLYHGLAGLAWCYTRDAFSGHFPDANRRLMSSAVAALSTATK